MLYHSPSHYSFTCNLQTLKILTSILIVLQLGPVEGVFFADYGTDLGSGPTVPGKWLFCLFYLHFFGLFVLFTKSILQLFSLYIISIIMRWPTEKFEKGTVTLRVECLFCSSYHMQSPPILLPAWIDQPCPVICWFAELNNHKFSMASRRAQMSSFETKTLNNNVGSRILWPSRTFLSWKEYLFKAI